MSFLKVCEGFHFLSESFPFLFSISCVGFRLSVSELKVFFSFLIVYEGVHFDSEFMKVPFP